MADARASYVEGKGRRAEERRAAERRARSIGTSNVAIAVAAVACVVARVWGGVGPGAWWAFAACVAAFAVLVVLHTRADAAVRRAAAALRFHERGLARLDDAWESLPATGERFAREDHPYADDLDIFGRASLFQRIDATETRFGEERLAGWLAAASEPVDLDAIRARQAAVKDLAPRVAFREALSTAAALATEDKPDPAPFLAWAEGAMPLRGGGALAVVAWILPVLLAAGVAASSLLGAPAWAWMVPLALEWIALSTIAKGVSPIASAVIGQEGAFVRFGALLQAIEREPFEAARLRELQATLRATGAEATREVARLERIVSFLEARNNEVWRLFVGPALLWDVHWVVALERWRARVGPRVRVWLDVIGEIEALASLAGFAFEAHGARAFPELVDEPCFVATKLGHPLIAPKKRVDNDVALRGGGTGLVVTGSNMSGKSTLLRAMGVNAVLALAGGPVCAERMAIGPLRVAASMRVRDSLSEGVSRFYAEVRKLKAVIERARSSSCAPRRADGADVPSRVPATLFLLDEVLHGTNSRERLIGARAIVRELIARGALGAVSTHDLALGDLDEELAGRVTNVHFEEQVQGDQMTFDYVLRPGVVKSSNALRIMRMVGIDVVEP